MSTEQAKLNLEREQDVRYLYENALSQIVCLYHFRTVDDQERFINKIKELAESALRHDFRAIYPGHTEQFHKEIRERHN